MTVFQLIVKTHPMHWTGLGEGAFQGLLQSVYLSQGSWQKCIMEMPDVYWSFSAKGRKFTFRPFYYFFSYYFTNFLLFILYYFYYLLFLLFFNLFVSNKIIFFMGEENLILRPTTVHSLFQTEKSLNLEFPVSEHRKPSVGSCLGRSDSCLLCSFTPCHGTCLKSPITISVVVH